MSYRRIIRGARRAMWASPKVNQRFFSSHIDFTQQRLFKAERQTPGQFAMTVNAAAQFVGRKRVMVGDTESIEFATITRTTKGRLLRREFLLRPSLPVSKNIARRFNLNDEEARTLPTWKDKIPLIAKTLDRPGVTTWFHGATYDRYILTGHFRHCAYLKRPRSRIACSLVVARLLRGVGGNTLGELADFFGVTPSGPLHRAMTDTQVLYYVLEVMLPWYLEQCQKHGLLTPALVHAQELLALSRSQLAKQLGHSSPNSLPSTFSYGFFDKPEEKAHVSNEPAQHYSK